MTEKEIENIDAELLRAQKWGLTFASLHECYAVIFEEVDELWDHVRLKRNERDPRLVEKELIQIATMAVKGLRSLHHFVGVENGKA